MNKEFWLARLQEEAIRTAEELTPAELVQVMEMTIESLQARGWNPSALNHLRIARNKFAALVA